MLKYSFTMFNMNFEMSFIILSIITKFITLQAVLKEGKLEKNNNVRILK